MGAVSADHLSHEKGYTSVTIYLLTFLLDLLAGIILTLSGILLLGGSALRKAALEDPNDL